MTVEEFIATNGVTKCAPAHAQGNEAKSGLRRHVAAKRRDWSNETGVALGVGMVRENEPVGDLGLTEAEEEAGFVEFMEQEAA